MVTEKFWKFDPIELELFENDKMDMLSYRNDTTMTNMGYHDDKFTMGDTEQEIQQLVHVKAS